MYVGRDGEWTDVNFRNGRGLSSIFRPYYEPLVENQEILSNALVNLQQLTTNCASTSEEKLGNLLDESDDTYFISDKEAPNSSQSSPSLQIDAKKAYKAYELQFRTNSEMVGCAPTKVHLFMTNTPEDESSWIDCGTDTLVYNDNSAALTIKHYDKMRCIRLQVEATAEKQEQNGPLYFSLSSLKVCPIKNARGIKWDDGLYYGLSNVSPQYNQEFLSGNSYIDIDSNDEFYFECNTKPIKNLVLTYSACKALSERTDSQVVFPRRFYLHTYRGVSNSVRIDADSGSASNNPQVFAVSFPDSVSYLGLYGSLYDYYYYYCGEKIRRLGNAHLYERPREVDILPDWEKWQLEELVSRPDQDVYFWDQEYPRMFKWGDYERICSIVNDIDVYSGRFIDFVDYDYATFYGDYPAVVPHLVKAGIVKEQNGELVVDYLYNEGDVIPAHTGVIIKGNCRGNAYVMEQGYTEATSPEGNLLHGTTNWEEANVEGCDRYYKLSFDAESDSKLGFYWGDSEGPNSFYNKPYKAFLALPASMNAVKMEGFSLGELEKGMVTAIANNEAHKVLNNDVYTIDGRKLNVTSTDNLPAGVYIVNGKKVMVN